jgi:uncharacterized RmlC-like cupin family protein
MNPAPPHPEAQCRLLRPGNEFTGKQGLQYHVGISAESCGARALHLQLVTIPPGGRARAHKHATHETALFALKGESAMWHGPRLEHHTIIQPGDFLYIPADVPHLPYNPSLTDEVVAVIARSDPNEQESVILLPELDAIHAGR